MEIADVIDAMVKRGGNVNKKKKKKNSTYGTSSYINVELQSSVKQLNILAS